MPTDLFRAEAPPADLQPVEFDFAAASNAARELRHAADVLSRSERARVSDARDAEKHWTGGQATVFARAEDATAHAVSDVVRRMGDAADELDRQAALARKENARRADARADWTADRARARQHEIDARTRAATAGRP